MFWAALGQALPLAVGIAVSPIPIVLLVLVLVTARPRVGGVVFATGWRRSYMFVIVTNVTTTSNPTGVLR